MEINLYSTQLSAATKAGNAVPGTFERATRTRESDLCKPGMKI